MCAHILVAEDNRRQAHVVGRYLGSDGHRVFMVHDGQEALAEARRRHPDLVILDVMMPGLDGLNVCRILRRESSVLMLTARSSEEDLLLGLGLGADDYLTKPYSPRELVARVRTLLRRVDRVRTDDIVLHVGDLTVDLSRRTVTVGENLVRCTPAEFAILAVMAGQPDRVFSRGQLLEHAQGVDRDSTDRAVDTHVLNLRRKIEADPRHPRRLLAAYGLGYSSRIRRPVHRLAMRSPDVPLHRSMIMRLLATSVLVAVAAIAATAWLTVQTTTQAIEQQQGRSIADDALTYETLTG